jgi:cyanosortase A-associated protein
MTAWKQMRVPLVAIVCGSVLLTLGKILLAPATVSYTAVAVTLPAAVPLADWQALASRPLATSSIAGAQIVAARQYQYQQSNLSLAIEMRYLAATHGDLKILMQELNVASAPRQLQQMQLRQQQTGSYSLVSDQKRAYLNACITPQGSSTATGQQFMQHVYIQGLQPLHLLAWLSGQKPLRDQRCLWAMLSLELKQAPLEVAYQQLEDAWMPWHQWWRSRFPED